MGKFTQPNCKKKNRRNGISSRRTTKVIENDGASCHRRSDVFPISFPDIYFERRRPSSSQQQHQQSPKLILLLLLWDGFHSERESRRPGKYPIFIKKKGNPIEGSKKKTRREKTCVTTARVDAAVVDMRCTAPRCHDNDNRKKGLHLSSASSSRLVVGNQWKRQQQTRLEDSGLQNAFVYRTAIYDCGRAEDWTRHRFSVLRVFASGPVDS